MGLTCNLNNSFNVLMDRYLDIDFNIPIAFLALAMAACICAENESLESNIIPKCLCWRTADTGVLLNNSTGCLVVVFSLENINSTACLLRSFLRSIEKLFSHEQAALTYQHLYEKAAFYLL